MARSAWRIRFREGLEHSERLKLKAPALQLAFTPEGQGAWGSRPRNLWMGVARPLRPTA